ncbi:MAG: hypothetical protein ACLFPV_07755, partial [Spirochaetaceae bacterium]
MTDTLWVVIALLMGLASVGVALLKYYWVTRPTTGDSAARDVARSIRRSARQFLRYLYLSLAAVSVGITTRRRVWGPPSPLFWARF